MASSERNPGFFPALVGKWREWDAGSWNNPSRCWEPFGWEQVAPLPQLSLAPEGTKAWGDPKNPQLERWIWKLFLLVDAAGASWRFPGNTTLPKFWLLPGKFRFLMPFWCRHTPWDEFNFRGNHPLDQMGIFRLSGHQNSLWQNFLNFISAASPPLRPKKKIPLWTQILSWEWIKEVNFSRPCSQFFLSLP